MGNDEEPKYLKGMERILSASVPNQKLCPYLQNHAEIIPDKNGEDKVYCGLSVCPYGNSKRVELQHIDLGFNECKTQGLVKVVKHNY